jgi:RNA polymerase sigma factor (sigma-70 family)
MRNKLCASTRLHSESFLAIELIIVGSNARLQLDGHDEGFFRRNHCLQFVAGKFRLIWVPMDLKSLSNTKLVKLCAKEPSNQQAWTEFHARFHEHIRLTSARECCRKNLNAASLLDDLVQNVYLRLVQKNCKALWDYEGRSDNAIYKYLAVIAHSAVGEYWTRIRAQKRYAKEVSLEVPVSGFPDEGEPFRLSDTIRNPDPDPDDALIRESERQEIEQRLDEILPEKSKDRDKFIFKLHFYKDFSPAQIAEQCGIPLSEKRIGNIITDIKKRLAARLRGG